MRDVGFASFGFALGIIATIVTFRIKANWWRWTKRLSADIIIEKDPAVYLSTGLPDWVAFEVFIPSRAAEDVKDDPPQSGRHAYRWAWGMGGWPARSHHVQITVVAREDSTILIEGIEGELVGRSRLPGGLHAIRAVGGADAQMRHVRLHMVEEPPIPAWINELGDTQTGPFKFNVTKGDPERFEIIADLEGLGDALVEWRVVLHLVANGRKIRKVVDDEGKPFQAVSLTSGANRQVWLWDHWEQG